MTRLSQALAQESGSKAAAERARTLAVAAFHKSNYPQMTGLSKTYEPLTDNPTEADKLPSEGVKVQINAEQVLSDLAAQMAKTMDVTLTVENGNAISYGTVVVDGQTLVTDAPVTWLLGLEKRLAEYGKVLDGLPVLDPAFDWTEDEPGIHKTDVIKTMRPTKVPRVQQLTKATPEHAETVQMWMEDVPHGHWSTVKFSGMLPAARIRDLRDRQAKLLAAVKNARMEANAGEVPERKAGDAMTAYLLGSPRAQA